MKDTELNPLNKKQRKLLQYGVVLMLVVFLAGYFFFVTRSKNTSVYLEDSKLQVFDESIDFEYPDSLEVNYPYLLIVKPEESKTMIYNLEEKKLEKTIDEIALDFANGTLLYNKGAVTYLDGQSLDILCEQGVIRELGVFCVTKVDPDSVSQKIVSINSTSQELKDIYLSPNLITDMSFVGDTLYIGEIDQISRKSYLVIDGKQVEAPNIVSIIYELHEKPHFASFKSPLNNERLGYYFIEKGRIIEQNTDKILFYDQNDN